MWQENLRNITLSYIHVFIRNKVSTELFINHDIVINIAINNKFQRSTCLWKHQATLVHTYIYKRSYKSFSRHSGLSKRSKLFRSKASFFIFPLVAKDILSVYKRCSTKRFESRSLLDVAVMSASSPLWDGKDAPSTNRCEFIITRTKETRGSHAPEMTILEVLPSIVLLPTMVSSGGCTMRP